MAHFYITQETLNIYHLSLSWTRVIIFQWLQLISTKFI